MGDGIMCEFGAPLDYQTHRLMAGVAAVKMQEKLGEHKHLADAHRDASGSAIAGLIGTRRQTYTAIGDIVNLAARLEAVLRAGAGADRPLYARGCGAFLQYAEAARAATKEKVDLRKSISSTCYTPKSRRRPTMRTCTSGWASSPRHGGAHGALGYIERALQLDPRNTAFKVAYAEAGMS